MLQESLKHPEDATLRMAYADWLDEKASERCEGLPCPRARFVRMGYHPGWIPTTPTMRQLEWLEKEGCDEQFEWGAGSGKTTALLMAALHSATHRGYQALLISPTYIDSVRVAETLRMWLDEARRFGAKFSISDMRWEFSHGAKIQLDAATEWDRYMGMSVNFVGLDGIEGMHPAAVHALKLRFRPHNGLPWAVRTT